MHPNPKFEWTDRSEMLQFVRQRAFAHVFTAGERGLQVAHAPLLVTPDGRIQFHLFRSNRAEAFFAGNRVLLSVSALDGYHSANWYESANQVPTWHYQVVEIEGVARAQTDEELTAQLDGLSAEFEGRFSPDAPWTRAKLDPGKFEGALKALAGFEVAPDEIRGTRKFNQHKSRDDIEANIMGQQGAGQEEIAAAIRDLWTGR